MILKVPKISFFPATWQHIPQRSKTAFSLGEESYYSASAVSWIIFSSDSNWLKQSFLIWPSTLSKVLSFIDFVLWFMSLKTKFQFHNLWFFSIRAETVILYIYRQSGAEGRNQWLAKKPYQVAKSEACSVTEQLARHQKKIAPLPLIFLHFINHSGSRKHSICTASNMELLKRQMMALHTETRHSCKMETLHIFVTSSPLSKR